MHSPEGTESQAKGRKPEKSNPTAESSKGSKLTVMVALELGGRELLGDLSTPWCWASASFSISQGSRAGGLFFEQGIN